MPEQPVDLGSVARDDALLDALGRGVQPPPDDEFAAMLASWRADLSDGEAEEADDDVAAPVPVQEPAPGRHRRPWRAVLAAAAAVLALAGTLTVVAGGAKPGSPLWPITTVVYAQRADSLVAAQDARHAIAQAREAVAAGRYAEADNLLKQAKALAGEVRDAGTRQQLLDEVAAVQALLPGTTPAPSASRAQSANPAPAPSRSPTNGASSGSHTGGGSPGGGDSGATPSPSTSAGGGLSKILPNLPLPSLPITLPTL